MLMTSGSVVLDFLFFFDFGAGLGEPTVFSLFKPWVLHFKPVRGITMTKLSHQDIG